MRCFKPRGIPVARLGCVVLTLDEFEALRLADLEERYQEDAAQQMEVSRPTFGRIVAAARYKVADALVNGKVLLIEDTKDVRHVGAARTEAAVGTRG